ncbi:cation diffusion facilitator transporter [Tepiditoga spiralis]|uniref:Cation diffusion facilitator transporter n=1 Tax=Tepiditoga spiralis TaxID=2108365 RepID=A0A7G1GA03_9BACT|nr:cation diffusion facilitator family transporter [Tepiditoga spiralis]BBE31863.1 cation diffusion facilitator transporter [Tepiditoga spiralis]
MNDDNRNKLVNRAAYAGIIGNTFLAILKLFIGIFTGSLAILADGIDTTTDIATSFLTLIAAKISNKPPDKSHPYGHEKIETIITKLLSLVIIFAGYNLLIKSIKNIITPEFKINNLILVLITASISVIIKYFLFKYKLKIGKKINSPSSIADAMNMKNDVLISLSVLIGITIYYFTGIKILDPIIALLVSLMIFKVGFETFFEASNDLMDGSKNLGKIYLDIVNVVDKYEDIKNPHKIRVRKSGFVFFVDMHLEINGEKTINEAHSIIMKIEKEIKQLNVYIKDITIHVEPIGNNEKECFGYDENLIKRTFGNEEENNGI